jgi:hypothetical protein
MLVIGIPLGIMIGILSGIALLLFLKTILEEQSVKKTITVVGEILAIPVFWFGGSWVTTPLLESIDREEMLPYYILALSCTWVPIGVWGLYRLMTRIGNEKGKAGRNSND